MARNNFRLSVIRWEIGGKPPPPPTGPSVPHLAREATVFPLTACPAAEKSSSNTPRYRTALFRYNYDSYRGKKNRGVGITRAN